MKRVAVSGYFDPIHIGHLAYLNLAKKLGDKLVAKVKVQKKTKTLVFLTCEIINAEGVVAVTSGVWKILKINK